MQLVIVESPTKARKLTQFLGSGYKVEASVGHVRDLPKSSLGVDLENDFEPVYEVSADKLDVVKKLQKLSATADKVILATDPDREGEAIAWHIEYLLTEEGKGKKKTKSQFLRASFHEITKSAVDAAIASPGKINMDLVDAQQARRVLDRLVGYRLSPVLWKKVRRGLSAGRVQSAALRLIAEREAEIEKFKAEEYWEVDVALSTKKDLPKTPIFKDGKPIENPPQGIFVARVIEVNKKAYQPTKKTDTTDVVKDLEAANYVIASLEKKERRRSSLPPFSTSLLQQAAANRLGMSGKQTMSLAQQLYEEGLITYHRTDSFTLSSQAIDMARKYIDGKFGKNYLPEQPRIFANKSKMAQEAHEAIRVTDIGLDAKDVRSQNSRFTERHAQLYDLIWRRYVASQMEAAVYDSTTVLVDGKAKKDVYTLKATGSILKFDGWMRLFPNKGDIVLPDLSDQQQLYQDGINAAQKFTLPPPRYNDASLIKTLEEKGIGRPSTYASIISVIVDRGYVERKEKRFFATPVGVTVSGFLIQHFPEIVDYDFTAGMEDDLDLIAEGKKEWRKIIKTFFSPFEKLVKSVEKNAERAQIPVEKTGNKCPKCGATEKGEVVIRSGKFGKFLSCSRFPDCDYTEALVDKLEGVKCPLCSEGDVVIKNSRWGKPFYGCSRYPECNWASWGKPEPGLKITAKEWEKMQAARAERKAARLAKMGKTGKVKKARKTKTRKKIKSKI